MSIPTSMDVVVASDIPAEGTSYVDWPAVIAGIVLATAIALLLLAFGTAVGLSFVNFHAGPDASPVWIAIAAASWLLWVTVSSFMAGAYLTGRLRRRHNDATEAEVDVRDGAHGLLVWAGALIVGALITASGLSAVATAVGSAAATLTNAAATAAGDGTALDPTAYYTDLLFRPLPDAPATTADTSAARAEAGRILAQGAVSGTVGAADTAYLGQLVATTTGMPAEAATDRVGEVMTAIDTSRAEAAELAEAARQSGVIGAFITAATLLVAAAAAFWAAQKGGTHRDQGTVFPRLFNRF